MILRTLFCAVLCIAAAVGQPPQISSSDYYIGKGEGASLDAARARAYTNMVEQIQVLVSSSLRTSTTENNSNFQQTADQSPFSFSSIMLRDVQEKVEKHDDLYTVTKFVSKASVRSMFEQRRQQVMDYLTTAEAEGSGYCPVDLQRMFGNYYKAWLMAGLYPVTMTFTEV